MANELRLSVADDEPDMREYFGRILPSLGYQVVSIAANGQELLEHFKLHRPDLVITDVCMPDMDGLEAAQRLYQIAPTPVILISAHHYMEHVRLSEANHVINCLLKPIKRGDLKPAISSAMDQFRQLAEKKLF